MYGLANAKTAHGEVYMTWWEKAEEMCLHEDPQKAKGTGVANIANNCCPRERRTLPLHANSGRGGAAMEWEMSQGKKLEMRYANRTSRKKTLRLAGAGKVGDEGDGCCNWTAGGVEDSLIRGK